MRINIKSVFIIILIAIIGIFSLVILKKKYNIGNANKENVNRNNENETTYSEHMYYGPDSYTSWELGYEVAKKNGDWSRLPLSNEFRNKYNERDGILGDLEYDEIELAPYDNDKKYFDKYYFVNRNCYFVITQGKAKIAYVYNLKYDDKVLNDVLIIDICNLVDEYGKELDVSGYGITNDNFKDSMDFLARGKNDEMSVAVTPNFRKKYPYFLDIFEHYSPLAYNHIEFVEEKSSWENKEAYFIVDSKLECKKRYYKVKFTLDDRGYLDDVNVNKANEEEYGGIEHDGGIHIFYINSNWTGLDLTDNFRNKFNYKTGVFPDIHLLGYNFSFDNSDEYQQIKIEGKANVNQIRAFKIDNDFVYYLYQVYKNEEGKIEDVFYDRLPYSNISIDEAKELYLKEYSK